MINQLNLANVDKTVFTPLQSNGAPFAITKPITEAQKQDVKEDTEKKNEKRGNKLGYAMASIAVVVGFGVFAVTRLLSKRAGTKLNKFNKIVDNTVAKLSKNKHASSIQKFWATTLKNVKILIPKSHAVFNFATLKDIFIRKMLTYVPILRKASDAATNWFEKVSVGTTRKEYSKTLLKFDNLYADFDRASAKLPESERKKVADKIKTIKTKYDEGFSTEARNKRLLKVDEDLGKLDEVVWKDTYLDVKGLYKKAINGRFLVEDLAKNSKDKLHDSVMEIKKIITLGVHENYTSIKKMLDNVELLIDPTDSNLSTLMKSARKDLDVYRKNNSFDDKSAIVESLTKLNKALSSEKDPNIAKKVSEGIDLLSKTKKGNIQEIMEIYKKHNLPKEEYVKLEKSVNNALKSLDKSVDLETDKLFDKIRDLKIGSAPHDVLAFLSSLGVVGWYLGKADNNDERMSVTLKYGIPVIGAVAITTLCTVGLIASGPSLLIGIVSGLAINKVGEVADDIRKKYKEKPVTLTSATEEIIPKIKEDIEVLEGKDSTN